ncbi:MAG: PilZ domain-containing protein, partial [Bdellovibrionales bacterium]|nr:PilZ domain-containing protein [Bdellovibrionales bacterium]
MDEELFSKIESQTQRDKIFDDIMRHNVEIQIQLMDNTVLSAKSFKKFNDEFILFRELPNQPTEQDVIITFNLAPEKYFLKSKLIQKDKTCIIKLTAYLYKLQRRKNFRLTLPKFWDPTFDCLSQGAEQIGKSFTIHDLSNGGISIEYAPGEFETSIGSQMEGLIKVNNRLDLSVTVGVRHIREVGTKAYPKIRVGLEIINMTKERSEE